MGTTEQNFDFIKPESAKALDVLSSRSGSPAVSKYVEIRTTASGKKLGRKADGTIEEIK
jgi:hypothetical protein